MNRIKTYFTAALAIMTVAACSTDNDRDSGPLPVRVIATLARTDTRQGTVDNEWPNQAEVAMRCDESPNGGQESGAQGNTYKYLVTAGSNVMMGSDASNTFFWEAEMTFTAWYPYNNKALPGEWILPANQSHADLSNYDLLYAHQELILSDNVTMSFHHQLARVTVMMSDFINLYPAALTIHSVKLGAANVRLDRTLTTPSTTNGAAVWDGGTANSTVTMQEITPNMEYTCLLPPQVVGNTTITVETSDGTFISQTADNINLTSALHKTYNLTLENNRLAVIRTDNVIGWKMISGVVASSKAWTANGHADVWVSPWEEIQDH